MDTASLDFAFLRSTFSKGVVKTRRKRTPFQTKVTTLLPSAFGFCVEDTSSNVDSADAITDHFSDLTIIENTSQTSPDSAFEVEATHIIVLMHGLMGKQSEMGYISESIQNAIGASRSAGHKHRFAIHSAVCNNVTTDDGIVEGGSRLAEEINQLVQHVVGRGSSDGITNTKTNNSSRHYTFSIVGNSLGGLYARQALSGINWDIGGSVLIPMVFVTTATPHLGVNQHTYVPLPRAAEYLIAFGLKKTGKDLFRFTRVIEDLFRKDDYLEPLSNFRQRIAYINVYGTDFQVPTATAAFWVPGSGSLHYRVRTPSEGFQTSESSSPVVSAADPTIPKAIVMMLTTPRCPNLPERGKEPDDKDKIVEGTKVEDTTVKGGVEGGESKADNTKENDNSDSDKSDPATLFMTWSNRLDGLGWTKVLVDVREYVPCVRQSISSVLSRQNTGMSADSSSKSTDIDSDRKEDTKEKTELFSEKTETSNDVKSDNSTDGEDVVHPIPNWRTKEIWTAGDLLAEYEGGLVTANSTKKKRLGSFRDWKPKLPMGHLVMIANAKDDLYKEVTSGGKPVMDYLGASLVKTLQESVFTE